MNDQITLSGVALLRLAVNTWTRSVNCNNNNNFQQVNTNGNYNNNNANYSNAVSPLIPPMSCRRITNPLETDGRRATSCGESSINPETEPMISVHGRYLHGW